MNCGPFEQFYPSCMVVNGLGNLGRVVLIVAIKGSGLKKINVKCFTLDFFLNGWLIQLRPPVLIILLV